MSRQTRWQRWRRTVAIGAACACIGGQSLAGQSAASPAFNLDSVADAALAEGAAAVTHHDERAAVAAYEHAYQLAPNYLDAVDSLAEEYGRVGNAKRASELLRVSIAMGSPLILGSDTSAAFAAVRRDPEFRRVQALGRKTLVPVARSDVAFRILQRDLIPEGVAYDPRSRAFFVSSTYRRKIIRITPAGTVSDYTQQMQDGIWGAVGIRVDTARGRLWVLSGSTTGMPMIGQRHEEDGCTAAFRYDLMSRRLVARYVLCRPGEAHFFNDLAITRTGDVYITDSRSGGVYRISASTDSLEVFIEPSTFVDPNGIALGPDERTLFVAHETGVDVFDLATRTHVAVQCPPTMSLGGIDGLAFFANSLVAVQSAVKRLTRYRLAPDLKRVTSQDVLDFRRPEFGQPTEGVIVGTYYYYSADAQFTSFENGRIYPLDRLRPVTILRAPLQ